MTLSPPFIISASLLFWGWLTQWMAPAVLMAVIVESPRLIQSRWTFSQADFSRISDLCTVTLFVTIVIAIITAPLEPAVIIFKWLPATLFPLLVAQKYSTVDKIDIGILFGFTRKKKVRFYRKPYFIDLSFPYIVVCLFSAGSANIRDGRFYIGLVLLIAWMMWLFRSKRYSPVLWITLLIAIILVGYSGHKALNRLQEIVVQITTDYFMQNFDPYRRTTALGDIGKLKLSDRIIFRVTPTKKSQMPLLIREASYNLLGETTWYAAHTTRFDDYPEYSNERTWMFSEPPETYQTLTISDYLHKGKGILRLPNGTFQIRNLPVVSLKKNPLGTVKAENGPGFISYQADYSPNRSIDSAPNKMDLTISKDEKAVLNKIIHEFNLQAVDPDKTITRLNRYFDRNFTYSLVLTYNKHSGHTPIEYFLLQSKKGHCEYFATATVLLLRACGIPARYAFGYSAHEYSNLEDHFVVRSRHAHAWALAYHNGRWHDIDTTPPGWTGIEDTHSSFQFISDVWAYIRFTFADWRRRINEQGVKRYALWLLVPLFIILGRRLHSGKKLTRVKTQMTPADDVQSVSPGLHSAFYKIEKKLNRIGFERHPGETLPSWFERIEETSSILPVDDDLVTTLNLHYKSRFHAHGLHKEEEALLEKNVSILLDKIDAHAEYRVTDTTIS